MVPRIALTILLISLMTAIITEKGDCTDPVLLNLTLTTPHAGLSLTDNFFKENRSSIFFRNATLYLNNSSIDLSRGYIKSKNTTIKAEMAAMISKNATTNLSNLTVEMPDSTLNLMNAELNSNQSELKALNTNLSLKYSKVSAPNGTLAVITQVSSTDQKSLMEQWNVTATTLDENWIKPFFGILNVFASLVIFALIICVIWRLRPYLLSIFGRGGKDLVFDKIINSSGDETLEKRLDGISQFAREELIDSLVSIQKKIEIHSKEQGPAIIPREFLPLPNSTIEFLPHTNRPRDYLPLPTDTPKKSLSDILASIKDVTPEIWKPLLPLIGILFPSRGIKVSCILQREGDKDSKLGITIKVCDMEDKLDPRIHTIWEMENSSAQTSATHSDPQTKWMQAQTLHTIGLFLEQLGFFSDAMKYHKEALGILDSWKPPKKHLESCSKRLAELEIAATHYSAGESYRKEKDTDNALKNYLLALAHEDKQNGERAWKAILGLTEKSDSANYFILANLYKKAGLFEEATKLYNYAIKKGNKDASKALKNLNMNRVELLLNCAGLLQRLKRFKESKNYYEYAIKIDPNNLDAKSEIEKINLELDKNTSLFERYIKLLKPASIWTATEIRRMNLLQNVPWKARFGDNNNYQSEILNFFGVLNLYYALVYGQDYYEFSKDDIEMAIKLSPDWFLPHENLGMWFLQKGHEGTNDNEPSLQIEAIRCYKKALANVPAEYSISKVLENRIEIEKAIACYLSGDNSLIKEACDKINEIVDPIQFPDDNNWINKINEWGSARSLYNLACWYEMTKAGCKDSPEGYALYAEKRAKICLAYSLARDKNRNLWNSVSRDKDLKSIDAKDIERLKFAILKELNNKPELPYFCGKDFGNSMDHILREMKWIDPPKEQKTISSNPEM